VAAGRPSIVRAAPTGRDRRPTGARGARLSACRRPRAATDAATSSSRAPRSARNRSAPCSCRSAGRCRGRTCSSRWSRAAPCRSPCTRRP